MTQKPQVDADPTKPNAYTNSGLNIVLQLGRGAVSGAGHTLRRLFTTNPPREASSNGSWIDVTVPRQDTATHEPQPPEVPPQITPHI